MSDRFQFTGPQIQILIDDVDAVRLTDAKPVISNLSRAMARALVVTFNYDGERRDVEVHAIGVSGAGNHVMRGWQIGKDTWRLFTVDKIEDLQLTFIESVAPRRGYALNDKQMASIISQLG